MLAKCAPFLRVGSNAIESRPWRQLVTVERDQMSFHRCMVLLHTAGGSGKWLPLPPSLDIQCQHRPQEFRAGLITRCKWVLLHICCSRCTPFPWKADVFSRGCHSTQEFGCQLHGTMNHVRLFPLQSRRSSADRRTVPAMAALTVHCSTCPIWPNGLRPRPNSPLITRKHQKAIPMETAWDARRCSRRQPRRPSRAVRASPPRRPPRPR